MAHTASPPGSSPHERDDDDDDHPSPMMITQEERQQPQERNYDGQQPSDQQQQPMLTQEQEQYECINLTNEERLLAFADLYGRKPITPEAEMDQRMEEFNREMCHLPASQKTALHRGYTVKQARLFLTIEQNDPKRAAKRMAQYWERRVQLYGMDDAFGGMNQFRGEEDHRSIYQMAMIALRDEKVNDETKYWATKFVEEWNRSHVVRLDAELGFIPDHQKVSLMEAQKSRPDGLAASDEHKLLFLRREEYDHIHAAKRMVKYWDIRYTLFGSTDMLRDVTVQDLKRDHPIELELGYVWRLQGTDAYGRSLVYFSFRKVCPFPEEGCTEEGLVKVLWYMLHSLMESESCRENGIVLLIDHREIGSHFHPKLAKMNRSLLLECLPVKIKAAHLISHPTRVYFRILLPIVKWIIGKTMRMRLGVHTGSEEDILKELEECGISRTLVPTVVGGDVDVDCVGKAWLQERNEAGM